MNLYVASWSYSGVMKVVCVLLNPQTGGYGVRYVLVALSNFKDRSTAPEQRQQRHCNRLNGSGSNGFWLLCILVCFCILIITVVSIV